MKRWDYAVNSIFGVGGLLLEEAPWWAFALEYVMSWWVFVPAWRLPAIRCAGEDGEETDLRKEYGTLDSLWFECVYLPMCRWLQPKIKSYEFDIDYNVLKKELYPHNPKFFDVEAATAEARFAAFAEFADVVEIDNATDTPVSVQEWGEEEVGG